MDELEKRARELLAVEWEKDGRSFTAQSIRDNTAPVDDYDCARVIQRQRSIRAIIAALSAAPQVPEGWVLVPVGPTDEMSSLGNEAIVDGEGAAGVWLSMIGALLAAKPEPPK